MLTDEVSCSECRLELIQRRWTELLLIWLNNCVHPKAEVKQLNLRSLVEIINRYKHDICANDFDRAMLCTDDLEPFLTYKYPILRLRFIEDEDIWKKLYLMTSVLLYHCCINSLAGVVVADICRKLDKNERELILVFCEKLKAMETTMNNVESAIKEACDEINETRTKSPKYSKYPDRSKKVKEYIEEPPAVISIPDVTDSKKKKVSMIKFESSVNVTPSYVTFSYSKISLQPDSWISSSDYTVISASCKLNDAIDRTTASKSDYITDSNTIEMTGMNDGDKKNSIDETLQQESYDKELICKPDCSATGAGRLPGSSMQSIKEPHTKKTKEKEENIGDK